MPRPQSLILRTLLPAMLVAFALLPNGAALAAITERVNVDSAGAQAIGGSSSNASTSADGRYVAFNSSATNLVAGDTNGQSDIFLRDRQAGTTERVSVDSAGVEANSYSLFPSISADGRYVAFRSVATNLVAGDTNGQSDVFVRDRQAGTTERVSVDSAGAQAAGDSLFPAISADGRYVAFHSLATNLVAGDTNGTWDVFVRDRQAGTTERVSEDSAEAQSNDTSTYPAISADGRYVAFSSHATNLVAGDTNSAIDIFVRDRQSGTTERVSVDSAEAQSNDTSEFPSISADGRYVAFHSSATNLVAGDANGIWDVFVRDRQAGTTERVSVDSAGLQGNNQSSNPSISADGRYVAFYSSATNLVVGDANGTWDVFVRDRQAGTTERVSVDSAGLQGNNQSSTVSISAGGLYVAFYSLATNLVAGDTNGQPDVFVRSFDDDGDLVHENDDNCPGTANGPGQAGVWGVGNQADADGDGIAGTQPPPNGTFGGDACDVDDDNDGILDGSDVFCRISAEDFDGFQDNDGCPDPDNDNDGVCDPGQTSVSCTGSDSGQSCFDPAGTLSCAVHDCRNTAEDIDGFKDGDGCPDPDNDNDSFPDATDSCPGADASAGADGMFGAPEDVNHNGVVDRDEAEFTTDDVMPLLMWEDKDGVLDTDGCHDSPGDDFDGDGLSDDVEVFTYLTEANNPDTDADTIQDGPDNCPLWPNTAQNLPPWTVGASDSDCDGFTVARELFVGTDPTKHCNMTTTANDEAVDFWPSDFNDSRSTNLSDLILMGPSYNKFLGNPAYNARFDLNASNGVNLSDVILLGPFYNTSCT